MDKRNLDSVYFRIERNGKWGNRCFSDLTEEEMRHVLNERNTDWLAELCIILGKELRRFGDLCDVFKD